jgi:hypothetical protein
MKPSTYRQIEARYGFTIDEIRPEHYPRSWKKFTLKASYSDGRRLLVYVWKRLDVHTAIANAIKIEIYCARCRAAHREGRKNDIEAESALRAYEDGFTDDTKFWDTWAAKGGFI